MISRRSVLAGAGVLVVGARPASAQPHAAQPHAAQPHAAQPGAARLAPDALDSWIAVHRDGTIEAFFGKMDPGQGVDVAIRQIVADELDVAVDQVVCVMGDTATSVNQGGASGSTGIEKGGVTLRYAAAEARRVLRDMAARRLGVPPDALTIEAGVVRVAAAPDRQVSYAELIGNDRFDVALQWNGQRGNDLLARGRAEPKSPAAYKVVGTSVPRTDIPEKVVGRHRFVTDIRLPGMLHGRMVRPAVATRVPVAVDAASIAAIPGARVVWKQGFLGVVAPREWDAIQAARTLRVTWSDAAPPFAGHAALYDHIRAAVPLHREEPQRKGDPEAANAGAARQVEAVYEWPFQSHACMGPACAVADVHADGATVWTPTQKPHYARLGVARIAGLPEDRVRAIWVRGAGSYGRNDAGDCALDAAVLSQAVGAPVRVQYMRDEGHGWDPKGPASIHRARAALDADGRIQAYRFESRGFSRTDIVPNESDPRHSLAGQLMGSPLAPEPAFGIPTEPYVFPAELRAWETIAPLLDRASPLRTSHLRDPVGPQLSFASESFMDEMAHAAGADPVAFRLRHLTDARGIATIRAAAERFGWEPYVASSRRQQGAVVTGRGFAYAQRGGTVVAVAVAVTVDRATGSVHPRRWAVAHDCGLVINPAGLRLTIEGNIVQGTSRALFEEVTFDAAMVTSLDWQGYPILDIADAPEAIDIVVLEDRTRPPSGAGESAIRPVAAAIANAVFDATGVRLRRAPLTADRVKAALA